ncbi:MAG: hypothetical protein D6750_03430, partial [Bacteroidetes bacterium]
VTDNLGCWDTLSVTLPEPAPLAVVDSAILPSSCLRGANGSLSLTVSGGNPPYTFQWRDATGAPLYASGAQVVSLAPGRYEVQIVDRKGCTLGPRSYEVPYLYHAQIDAASAELVADCPEKRMRFTVQASGVPPLTYTWTWDDGTQETTTGPTAERAYDPLRAGGAPVKVEVFSAGQCTAETTFTVQLTACSGLLIPTTFTPNGDGINDTWVIQALGFSRYTLIVYDRWGGEVWTNGGDPTRLWDGRNKAGQPLPEGAYVFYFTGTDVNGKVVQRSGTVSLLR